jgi:hypothetical protein
MRTARDRWSHQLSSIGAPLEGEAATAGMKPRLTLLRHSARESIATLWGCPSDLVILSGGAYGSSVRLVTTCCCCRAQRQAAIQAMVRPFLSSLSSCPTLPCHLSSAQSMEVQLHCFAGCDLWRPERAAKSMLDNLPRPDARVDHPHSGWI